MQGVFDLHILCFFFPLFLKVKLSISLKSRSDSNLVLSSILVVVITTNDIENSRGGGVRPLN